MSQLASGQPVSKETLLGEHKAFDGVKLPTHLVELAGGRKVRESKSATYRLLDKVDEGVFGKPWKGPIRRVFD